MAPKVGQWLSFADPDKPRGKQFLGVAIIEASTPPLEAIAKTSRLGINPGGEVVGYLVNLEDYCAADIDRLLTESEALRLGNKVVRTEHGIKDINWEEEKMSVLSVADRTGDTRLQWDKSNEDEVNAAQTRFSELQAKGWPAFKVNKRGDRGEKIDAFDPEVERIIFVPPIVGG
jgi:hypothetical protein